ncbi:MAG: RNA 2',3'-cyclic phosphodiesterase [Candidatus Bathyarchaeia archaeon]|nr:RNA 2',3'-cyclic phosphodiesterase [Candidatus Bathyarchaeota archaeon]
MSEFIRCFIAIDVDQKNVIEKILSIQKVLEESKVDLKLVEPQNIHLTLKFLGEINEEKVKKVIEAIKDIQFKPFKIILKGLGVFPTINYPRVLWVGVTNGFKEISLIFLKLEDKLAKLGFPKEERGFSPHLTIARVKSGKEKTELIKVLEKFKNEEIGEVPVESIKLKRSILTSKGPIYSTLFEIKP